MLLIYYFLLKLRDFIMQILKVFNINYFTKYITLYLFLNGELRRKVVTAIYDLFCFIVSNHIYSSRFYFFNKMYKTS